MLIAIGLNSYLCMFVLIASVILTLMLAHFPYLLGVTTVPKTCLLYSHMLFNIIQATLIALTVIAVLLTLAILPVGIRRATNAVRMQRVKTLSFTRLGKVPKVYIISSAMP